ncbi:hypothetical protein LTR78_003966 [Recurvomyces mirabilis]|uniref:Zn(2)-C6 fungal-type domain-containing protein n=1 Tax=Recurvomyces mirabilis TaxID=574656 RepID=A0AAE0WQZ5_9PEZI|nr:hypothetical protein LTR78_003966 [Recurvomyces mirabilis]KAK5153896.1 hypothetical protein LTS14_007116 [Recurvomyces mirabilis]
MASFAHLESSDSSQRRERAAIAAQACQTCRNRKSKCDEQRPKCGLCQRLSVDCEYREPLPTKKDKTMVHILDTLTRLENKFDNMAITQGSSPDMSSPGAHASVSGTSSASLVKASQSETAQRKPEGSAASDNMPKPYQHLTVPHKIMLWPGIYIHLLNSGISAASDLQYVLQEGTPWFIKREMSKHPDPLPSDVGLPCFTMATGNTEQSRATNVVFPTLGVQQIQELSDAYFNTFNVLYPVLNRETFMNGTVAKLLRDGYGDGDSASVLALLVFALGAVAVDGVFERPVSVVNGQPSGFRGGTVDHPPGLALFNEARRRLGFIWTQCTLENVQLNLLQATYYEATSRHLDFWRCTVAASMACQVLIRCEPIDWSSANGDLVKRAYWTCVFSEDLYHLDLDFPQTGINTMEDEVPLPYFHEAQEQHQGSSVAGGSAQANQERSHFQYHFLAMIALRRLIARIHNVIHECERAMQAEPLWRGSQRASGTSAHKTLAASSAQAENFDDYGGPPVAVIREMMRQLDSWRALLPRPLQWSDNDRFEFPATDPMTRRPNEPLFSPDQGPIPIGHKYNLDVVTAQLRTRFYYARFMMYRPFVYKALHFPELMTEEDGNCCALALKSACLWPLAMAPPKNKKRLVPHMFAWTQNFMGILLVLNMCSVNDCLRQIVDEGTVVSRREIESTIGLLLEWMRDVKQVDGIAEWSWGILEPLYGLRPER